MQIKKGNTDYDYDRYGRKIRKYLVTDMKKVHGRHEPVWTQILDFKAETKIPKVIVDTSKRK